MAEIDEKQREKIRKEAKHIIDNFVKSLEKVKIKTGKEMEEVGGFREEGPGKKADSDFRRIMFKNAPNKSGDSIIAEKKSW